MKRVAVKEGLFTLPQDNTPTRLLGGQCSDCDRFHFPVQSHCPYCSAEDCQQHELSAHGKVEVCTTVINRPPGYDGPMPFGFGVVELPEGIRVIARLLHPERIEAGARVCLTLDPIGSTSDGDEIVTYAFALESGG